MTSSRHGEAPLRVVIAVPTYRRPRELDRLLPALVEHVAASQAPATRIILIDNDPEGSAAPRARVWSGRGVEYVHEPTPGLSAARNRALDAATDADVLLFIDDDEEPAPGWLDAMVAAWSRWHPAAVSGPVEARFEVEPGRWIRDSAVFDTVQRPDGARVAGAATNNLLLDLRRLRAIGARFDPRFGLTGGEDTRFTHGLVSSGEEIRWCAGGLVLDHIPRERLDRRWVLRRRLRTSSSWTRVIIDVEPTPVAALLRRGQLAARAGARAARAVLVFAAGTLLRRPAVRTRAVVEAVNAAGMLLAIVGSATSGYGRPAPATAGRTQ